MRQSLRIKKVNPKYEGKDWQNDNCNINGNNKSYMKANDVTQQKQTEYLSPLTSSSKKSKIMSTPLKTSSSSKATTYYRSKCSHKRRERRKR